MEIVRQTCLFLDPLTTRLEVQGLGLWSLNTLREDPHRSYYKDSWGVLVLAKVAETEPQNNPSRIPESLR